MRFWLDTEFIEAGHQWPLELISIGVVSEDDREYVAYNQELDFVRLFENDWLVENVLPYLPVEKRYEDRPWAPDNVLLSAGAPWKKRAQIAREILAFVETGDEPEWWSYYADYDWVVLCQLYGSMVQLPEGWPMFCMDVKQWCVQLGNPRLPAQEGSAHNVIDDARHHRVMWNFLNDYARSDVHRCPKHPSVVTEFAPCSVCALTAGA